MDTAPLASPRPVERLVAGRPTSDGAGVRLTRVFANDLHARLDPFLMLDAFQNENPEDYIAGFPDHPHRGFETVTYMLAGRMRHRDSAGNEGLLVSGGAQWMTAGSGLIHSEIPEQEDGLMEGFQLWLNLPARDKMSAPHYKDLGPDEIPEFERDGARVRVLAGESHGVAGALRRSGTEPLYLDVHLPAGGVFEQPLDPGFNAFAFAYRGSFRSGGETVPPRAMALYRDEGDGIRLESELGARLILVAGRPLREPIAAYGPFVMNTTDEIRQAFDDYRAGLFESGKVRRD